MPAIAPPWTELVAYDLNEGTIKWRTPLGTIPALAAKGIKNTGSVRPRGGPIVTAGGLLFVGSGGDGYIHAFDKDTGKILWETEIDGNPDGIPAVYEVDGRQCVASYAAGGGDGICDESEQTVGARLLCFCRFEIKEERRLSLSNTQ